MKTKALTIIVIGLLAISAGVYVGMHRQAPVQPATGAAAQLLQQPLQNLQGQTQALARFKGKTMLVNFWATWCTPCVEEMPELNRLQQASGQNLQVIGLGVDSGENIAEFAKKYHISYPLYVVGTDGIELSRALGNQAGGLPYTVLLDKNGQVQKMYLGRLRFDELHRDLAALH